jgi:hypothetical protein
LLQTIIFCHIVAPFKVICLLLPAVAEERKMQQDVERNLAPARAKINRLKVAHHRQGAKHHGKEDTHTRQPEKKADDEISEGFI